AARDLLARAGIWGRIFPWHRHWLRLGIPGNRAEFARLHAALTAAG
ncbi:MAG TPA: threonine-phosphate decarboxylase, partial [Paracoccus sp. (in: a-proteobacteria)]|nr:threonine-phosphate decarboxylase [Paracoccus sp. (in: a-proteobacteria)]